MHVICPSHYDYFKSRMFNQILKRGIMLHILEKIESGFRRHVGFASNDDTENIFLLINRTLRNWMCLEIPNL